MIWLCDLLLCKMIGDWQDYRRVKLYEDIFVIDLSVVTEVTVCSVPALVQNLTWGPHAGTSHSLIHRIGWWKVSIELWRTWDNLISFCTATHAKDFRSQQVSSGCNAISHHSTTMAYSCPIATIIIIVVVNIIAWLSRKFPGTLADLGICLGLWNRCSSSLLIIYRRNIFSINTILFNCPKENHSVNPDHPFLWFWCFHLIGMYSKCDHTE